LDEVNLSSDFADFGLCLCVDGLELDFGIVAV